MIFLGLRTSLLGGIIVITLLIIPIFVRSMDEVARQLPKHLLEATYSLGATRYETIKVAIRQIAPGIATATLLSIGRAIGDAAGVMFTAGFTDSIPTSLDQPAATLPLAIFFQLSSPLPEVRERAYAAALLLTLIVLVLSIVGAYDYSPFFKKQDKIMEKGKSVFGHIFKGFNRSSQHDEDISLAEECNRAEDAVIKIENLNIYIRNNHILKNINLTLHDKKITCIIGPSGCGKNHAAAQHQPHD